MRLIIQLNFQPRALNVVHIIHWIKCAMTFICSSFLHNSLSFDFANNEKRNLEYFERNIGISFNMRKRVSIIQLRILFLGEKRTTTWPCGRSAHSRALLMRLIFEAGACVTSWLAYDSELRLRENICAFGDAQMFQSDLTWLDRPQNACLFILIRKVIEREVRIEIIACESKGEFFHVSNSEPRPSRNF